MNIVNLPIQTNLKRFEINMMYEHTEFLEVF